MLFECWVKPFQFKQKAQSKKLLKDGQIWVSWAFWQHFCVCLFLDTLAKRVWSFGEAVCFPNGTIRLLDKEKVVITKGQFL